MLRVAQILIVEEALRVGGDHLVARLEHGGGEGLRHDVERLGCVAREHDVVPVGCADELGDAMARYLVAKKKSEPWTRGVGIPYASTFLNGRMWETEQAAPESAPPDDGGEVREEWR